MGDNNDVKQETVNVESTINETTGNEAQQTSTYNKAVYTVPEEYKPISMWGYFGYEILFNIPIIGFICIIIFSVGGTSNKNLTNYARSRLCILIVVLAICGIMFFVVGTAALIKALPNIRY